MTQRCVVTCEVCHTEEAVARCTRVWKDGEVDENVLMCEGCIVVGGIEEPWKITHCTPISEEAKP